MFGIMRSGSRRRREAAIAREKACVKAGCKCYCHRPTKDIPMWKAMLILLAFAVFWVGSIMLLAHFSSNP